jgi:hypothetical protein
MKKKLNLEEEKEKFFVLLFILSVLITLNVVLITNWICDIR